MPAPRRKYTRKTPGATEVVGREFVPGRAIDISTSAELDTVIEIVTRLRALDAKARVRVTNAIGNLL